MFQLLRVLCAIYFSVTGFHCVSKALEKETDDLSIIQLEGKRNAVEFLYNCYCVFYYQCDSDGYVITDGRGLIGERIGEQHENDKRNKICDGGKFHGELVCCKHKLGEENKPAVTTPSSRLSTTSTVVVPTFKKPRTIQCGTQRPSINVRIFAEDELTPLNGEFPWLAAIYKRDASSNKWKYNKMGSLIHPKVILTASHVIGRSKPNELRVIVNGQTAQSQIGDNEAQERKVEQIIKHPEFNSGTLYNDVALVLLQEPYNVTTSPVINTICLQPEVPYENKRCFVVGWGKTSEKNKTSMELKKVELPTYSKEKCQDMLQKTRLGRDYRFHKSFLCAGGEEGKDACNGDGGSPLVCPTGVQNTMYQVGIVAYGIGCGMKDVPGVYADVTYIHSWIVNKLKEYDINI